MTIRAEMHLLLDRDFTRELVSTRTQLSSIDWSFNSRLCSTQLRRKYAHGHRVPAVVKIKHRRAERDE